MSFQNRINELKKQFGTKILFTKGLQASTRKIPLIKYATGRAKYSAIVEFLYNENRHLIETFNVSGAHRIDSVIGEKSNIWVLWWQGLENAPEIVKICISSIKKYSNGRQVVVLDKNNYSQYLSIQKKYIKMMEEKIITVTQFSDLLRLNLLYQQGGIWLDATYLLTDMLDPEISEYSFFSIRHGKEREVPMSKGLWSGSAIAFSKKNPVLELIIKIYDNYFDKRETMIDYLLIDYVFATCCDFCGLANKMFTNVKKNNVGVDDLLMHINEEYTATKYAQLTEHTSMHKLSWKYKFNNYKDERLTIYGYICRQYMEKR